MLAHWKIHRYFLTALLILVINKAVFACSLLVGVPDPTSELMYRAYLIFYIGILIFGLHIAIFLYRAIKNKRKNNWIFGTVLILSILGIPIVRILMFFSAGMACGHGAAEYASVLVIFELIGIIAQVESGRFHTEPIRPIFPKN